MKKALYILIPLILVAVVALRLKANKETSQQRVYHYDKEQPIPVQVDTLVLQKTAAAYAFTGTFEPNRETKLSAEVQGKVDAILVETGTRVRKGQPLVQLDNALLRYQLQAVNVQIEGLEADVKRYTVLVDADAVQGVQLEKAILGMKSAKVQRSTLQEQIRKSTITAPFDGIITAKLTEVGAFAAPGVPLLQLTDISQLKFTVTVPESELALFQNGQTYQLQATAYPDVALSGKPTMMGSKGNVANSFPVELTVQNTPDLKIKSGMFGEVKLQATQPVNGIVIPASAIVGSSVQPQVYLIRNNKATLQEIRISERIGNKAVVSSGLQEGDLVVTGGFINLYAGANVRVQ
ncbi:efflux RND transporter periplasmic adaptor subunit [uncultured Pontibacter sp.]|uniref:efflux RND transporter periplasmic adaptor subunit n=1 Tax=uncultured Pontibacter sp. TaxID=453356 RepID=UPI0026301FC8|nr:efflux RND transporter periplasmic adaptor subunit [uncultured Pontibacter sp.]